MCKRSGFLDPLKGPLKIISQNGMLIAITAAIYFIHFLIAYSFPANPFIIISTLKLFALVSAQPGTPEYTKLLAGIGEDIGVFLVTEIAHAVFSFFVLTFVQTSIILIASNYYSVNNLSLKELFMKVSNTWSRLFVTSFYVQLLALGYMISFFFLPFWTPSQLTLFHHPIILMSALIFHAIVLITFYLYLSVVWTLAVVLSVFEDILHLRKLDSL